MMTDADLQDKGVAAQGARTKVGVHVTLDADASSSKCSTMSGRRRASLTRLDRRSLRLEARTTSRRGCLRDQLFEVMLMIFRTDLFCRYLDVP